LSVKVLIEGIAILFITKPVLKRIFTLRWAITNAKYFDFNDSKIAIAPPEYVIIKKLEFFREGNAQKHINDIKAIIFNSKELINFSLLEDYLSDFGLLKEWALCK